MVGVPGRSKACFTCRKRKKGCDFARPACGQCKTAGFRCDGYWNQAVFVVSTPRSRRAGYSASSAPHPVGYSRQSKSRSLATAAPDIHVSGLLTRPECERRCINLFWEAYFPAGQPVPASISRSYTCTWTETARKLYPEDDALRYALWANSLLVVGGRNGTAWMLWEAQRMYGKALAGLRRSLGVPGGPVKDASIATVKLLAMFETSFPQRGDGATGPNQPSKRHHAGELALFVARTPMAHTRGDAHYVFADERVEMALSALLRRRRLELGSSEWKSIPWREIPKDLKDTLVDVLVEMPGLVEQFDRMQSCADQRSRAAMRLELLQSCWEHDRQLEGWASVVRQLGPPEYDPLSEGSSDGLVTRIGRVHGMTLFYTTSLVLYSILQMAAGPQESLPERVDPLHYATRLAQAIRILLEPSAGLYGTQSAAQPLEVASRYTAVLSSLSSDDSGSLLESLSEMRKEVKWVRDKRKPCELQMFTAGTGNTWGTF